MNRYKGITYYWAGDWIALDGYHLVARCETIGGIKRAITAYLKRHGLEH